MKAAQTGRIGDGKVWSVPGRHRRPGAHRRAWRRRALTGNDRAGAAPPACPRTTPRGAGAAGRPAARGHRVGAAPRAWLRPDRRRGCAQVLSAQASGERARRRRGRAGRGRRLRPRRAVARAATSTWCCCTPTASARRGRPSRTGSGTRSGTPGCTSTTRCARSTRPAGSPAADLAVAARAARRRGTSAGDAAGGRRLRSSVLGDWRAACPAPAAGAARVVGGAGPAHGDLRHDLEPDLKEGRGGLRDLVSCERWPRPGSPTVRTATSTTPYARLADVRDALHLVTGRPDQPLLLQEQDHGRRAARPRPTPTTCCARSGLRPPR